MICKNKLQRNVKGRVDSAVICPFLSFVFYPFFFLLQQFCVLEVFIWDRPRESETSTSIPALQPVNSMNLDSSFNLSESHSGLPNGSHNASHVILLGLTEIFYQTQVQCFLNYIALKKY